MSVTVIIPAYNEEKRISSTLSEYLEYFPDTVRFFVVLNGCHDNTQDVVDFWQKKYPDRVDYVVLDKSGKGWAVKKGFEKVQDEIIGFVDADNSTTAPEFDKILKKIEICDVAIGSRYTPGASVIHRVSWLRKLAGRLFHIIVRVITFLPFYDTQCGAKVFHKRVIEKILPELRVNNMAFDIEILFACLKNNFHVEEVPIYWSEGQASTFITSKRKLIKTSIGMLFSVIVMRIRYLFYTN